MQPWATNPFLVLDCETTGVDVVTDRIVEVASVELRHDGTHELWSTIVDPGIEIPEGASRVHGISTERAREEGVLPRVAMKEAAERVGSFIETYGKQGAIVMYNARFDWPLLIAEARRNDVEWPTSALIVDPMLLDKTHDKWRKGKRNLMATARHYGVTLSEEDAHGAGADALATGRVLQALLRKYPRIAEEAPDALVARQASAYDVQHKSFADWKRNNGVPDFQLDLGWPIPTRAM